MEMAHLFFDEKGCHRVLVDVRLVSISHVSLAKLVIEPGRTLLSYRVINST